MAVSVGVTENPIISILLETVSPENNDASRLALVMAFWESEEPALEPAGDGDLGIFGTTDTLGVGGTASTSSCTRTSSDEGLPEPSGTEA